MIRHVPFQQVDVFTNTPYKGNPVAVILDGDDLSTEEMQQIASWTNLSETTFVCTPTNPAADYRLRIFTPKSELPFAGHPTLGSAYALIKHGIEPHKTGCLVQESQIGLVNLFIEENKLFLTLPDSKSTLIEPTKLKELASALGISSTSVKAGMTIDVGAVWMTLYLTDAEEVKSLTPNMNQLSSLIPVGVTGITVFGRITIDSEAQFEVRSFAPNEGVAEDPVCGSGNGCVATMVKQLQLIPDSNYVASQGSCVGRDGRIEIRFNDDGKILLGGNAVTCIEGDITI